MASPTSTVPLTQAAPPTHSRSTSLVLGSGGAKGLAHIGVIRYLEEHHYDIRYVAGSSMGALVGGIYAAGQLTSYADWVCALQRTDMLRLLDWSFESGAFKGARLINVLRDLIGDGDIEDFPVGFTAVATDLNARDRAREVWINRGPLFEAVRASIAVPTIFEPVQRDAMLLVDGGVINPVPVAPTLNDQTALTIAVDLNGPEEPHEVLASRAEPKALSPLQQAYHESIGQYLDRLWPGNDETTDDTRLGFSDIAMRSMEAMQATITEIKLAVNPPTTLIRLPRNLCSFFDFFRAEELIDYGYEQARKALAAQKTA